VLTPEEEYKRIATAEALDKDVDPILAISIMEHESSFNPKAVSKRGARGLMQLMPAVSKEYGLTDPSDPVQNIGGGIRLLKELPGTLRQAGKNRGFDMLVNHETVLAAYNWGYANVVKAYQKYGDKWREHIPSKTKAYINNVSNSYVKYMMP
jgi:soluble lytic murein transglycosylase-like protein